MERLPEELIALICDHCDHASVKNARFVDSRWRAASTPATFEHFYMGLFGSGVLKLECLAKSPLRKYVKRFTIYSDILPDWTKESWKKAIDHRPPFSEWLAPFRAQATGEQGRLNQTSQSLLNYNPAKNYESLPRHDLSDEQLEIGYAAYKSCVRDQIHWRKNSLGIAFKEYFAMLPNLIEAKVQCVTPFEGRTNDWPVWKALREYILVGPDDWMYSTDFQETNYAYLSGHAALSLLEAVAYRASFSGTKQLTSLHIHSAHLDPYRRLMNEASGTILENNLYNSGIHQLHEGFRHLTRLHLHVPHATLSARLSGSSMAHETMEFSRLARQLRSLTLRYGDDELSPDDDASQLEALFRDGSENLLWPEIRHLALATNVPSDILIGFLRNHSKTLDSLELRDMLVLGVDSALEQIPQVVELQHVYMEQLWDDVPEDQRPVLTQPGALGQPAVLGHLCVLSRGTDFEAPYEQAVKSYLLGKSSKLPEIHRDGGFGDVMDWEEDDDPD